MLLFISEIWTRCVLVEATWLILSIRHFVYNIILYRASYGSGDTFWVIQDLTPLQFYLPCYMYFVKDILHSLTLVWLLLCRFSSHHFASLLSPEAGEKKTPTVTSAGKEHCFVIGAYLRHKGCYWAHSALENKLGSVVVHTKDKTMTALTPNEETIISWLALYPLSCCLSLFYVLFHMHGGEHGYRNCSTNTSLCCI